MSDNISHDADYLISNIFSILSTRKFNKGFRIVNRCGVCFRDETVDVGVSWVFRLYWSCLCLFCVWDSLILLTVHLENSLKY